MQSMDKIYREYAELVYRFLLGKTGNESIAEELTQETFYQAVKCSDRFDGSCKVSTWLCAIAKNQLASYLRKNHFYEELDTVELVAPSAEDTYFQTQQKVALMKELHAIPEPYREVMYLRLFGNLSFREIREIMEKTENWARVTFYRGKEKLRREDDHEKYTV